MLNLDVHGNWLFRNSHSEKKELELIVINIYEIYEIITVYVRMLYLDVYWK